MAEHHDEAADAPENVPTATTRRNRGARVSPRNTQKPARRSRDAATRPEPVAPRRSVKKPVRSAVILTMVAGLIATVALPAYAAWSPSDEAVTLQQASADDAQSLVVASEATASALERSSYSATTAEEIAKQKAEEAAAERARELAAAAAAASTSVQSTEAIDLSMVSPGDGSVRWPLLNFTKGRGLWDSGYHQGVDLLAAGGTPIYAAAAGVVRVSQESYGGYGVAVTIDHVIDGQSVGTLYGHMTYGSRQVSAGQYVEAGQLIGLVGSTGSSTANHLHFEVHINGSVVDPWAWLVNNAS